MNSETDNFTTELLAAIETKVQWYDTEELPRLLTAYRELQVHVNNITQTLLKKGSIAEDPYKHDKKISDIIAPEDTIFPDNERAVKIGSRLSDYDNMLDFIGNYLSFTVENITLERIRKLLALNGCFNWTQMHPTSTKPNTRAVAEMIAIIRQSNDTIAINVVNDSLTHSSNLIKTINGILKDLTDFHKEIYKAQIRKNILTLPDCPQTESEVLAFIKKNHSQVLRKQPYYSELVEDLLKEDFSLNRVEKRQNILTKLAVKKVVVQKKEKKINPKDLLLDAIRTLASVVPQLEQVSGKIEENKKVLESERNSFAEKFKAIFRKAFNIKEPPIYYVLTIIEPTSQLKRQEKINFQDFSTDILKRIRYYASISVKTSPSFQKIEALSDEKIMEFLNKHLSECQKLLLTLNALDEYFKTTPQPLNRIKIKGIKMEITAIKNTLVKTNQRRAEYATYIEEQNQLKKLGIIND